MMKKRFVVKSHWLDGMKLYYVYDNWRKCSMTSSTADKSYHVQKAEWHTIHGS
jgi:hypothetical protein